MNNWAPFLTGYQEHQVVDDTDSIWTLKGEVGILSRRVELRAHVTEWLAPEKVTFTLTGINEAVDGGGTLVIRRAEARALSPAPAPAPRVGWLRRMLNALARWLFHRVNRDAAGPPAALPLTTGGPGGGEGAELTFTLRMDAGGPAGPLVNAMLGPALEPAVEDLARKIAAHLESRDGSRPA
jgi:carbon monoxide dehydrogenase subunit G